MSSRPSDSTCPLEPAYLIRLSTHTDRIGWVRASIDLLADQDLPILALTRRAAAARVGYSSGAPVSQVLS